MGWRKTYNFRNQGKAIRLAKIWINIKLLFFPYILKICMTIEKKLQYLVGYPMYTEGNMKYMVVKLLCYIFNGKVGNGQLTVKKKKCYVYCNTQNNHLKMQRYIAKKPRNKEKMEYQKHFPRVQRSKEKGNRRTENGREKTDQKQVILYLIK